MLRHRVESRNWNERRIKANCGQKSQSPLGTLVDHEVFVLSRCSAWSFSCLRPSRRLVVVGFELLGLVVRDEGIDDGLQAAFHDQVELVQR